MKFKLSIITFLLIFMSGCESDGKANAATVAASQNNSATTTKNIEEVKDKNQIKTEEKIAANHNEPLELTLTNEQKIKIQKFEKGFKIDDNDQAVLFNFFATWCPPCKAEIPHLNNLQDKFKGKLKIISVLMEDKTKEEIEAFMKRYKIKFDVTYGESNFTFAKALGGVIGIPYMVLYKPDGTYAMHYVGLVPEEMLENDINKVIN